MVHESQQALGRARIIVAIICVTVIFVVLSFMAIRRMGSGEHGMVQDFEIAGDKDLDQEMVDYLFEELHSAGLELK